MPKKGFGRKFPTKMAREGAMAKVAELDRRGFTQSEIADELQLSTVTVGKMQRELRIKYAEVVAGSTTEMLTEKLEQYREIRKEAWRAWEKSKKDNKKIVEEFQKPFIQDKKGYNSTGLSRIKSLENQMEKLKEVITREGRLPGADYLNLVMKTLEAERELLGLDEPKQIDLRAHVFNWDALLPQILDTTDTLEAKIVEAGTKQIEDKTNGSS